MKQKITNEQLQTVPAEGKKVLYAWCKEKQYLEPIEGGLMLPLLSIGQIIEFLRDHKKYISASSLTFWEIVKHYPDFLCDKLWDEAVKVLQTYEK